MMLSSKFCLFVWSQKNLQKWQKIEPKIQGGKGELTFIAWPNMF